MREVKVPDFMQPFEVIVNGVKYVFPAGATVTVEDYIANIIEQSVPKEPPKQEAIVERVMWEDIGNRPFWEETVLGDTLYWDGNTEGLESVEMQGVVLSKVSDTVPTLAELQQGGVMGQTPSDGEKTELPFIADYLEVTDKYIVLGGYMVFFIKEDNCAVGDVIFPSKGTYFLVSQTGYISSLKINGYNGFPATTVKPLDEKYMPVLTSPNGTKFKISVGDDGSLSAAEV